MKNQVYREKILKRNQEIVLNQGANKEEEQSKNEIRYVNDVG